MKWRGNGEGWGGVVEGREKNITKHVCVGRVENIKRVKRDRESKQVGGHVKINDVNVPQPQTRRDKR